ncbi:MAG: hypothetical protein LUC93_00980, partial [Planctomycetaceae bacterium]|nr:hypothetical protein [Planctomycetaceae bacterium]
MSNRKSGNAGAWLEVRIQMRNHYKVLSSAKLLDIPNAYMRGLILSLWLGALEFAEDGDLWRGDDTASIRFVGALAEVPFEPERFIEVLRLDRWLDGWLIHDWLDYVGKLLYTKYKSSNRGRLVEIWTKHGRQYGRGTDSDDEEGCGEDAEGMSSGCQKRLPSTLNPNPIQITLNPYALDNKKGESPKGGLGESETNQGEQGILHNRLEGKRVKGFVATQAELTGDGLPHKEVYEAFLPLLVTHTIITLESFYERVRHCRTTPSRWTMLFLDKIHAIYRARNGKPLLDVEDADPVGMTVAALHPKKGQ